jgi:hypothetical protein
LERREAAALAVVKRTQSHQRKGVRKLSVRDVGRHIHPRPIGGFGRCLRRAMMEGGDEFRPARRS